MIDRDSLETRLYFTMASGSQGIVVCFRRDDKEYDLDATMITADTLQRVFRVSYDSVSL